MKEETLKKFLNDLRNAALPFTSIRELNAQAKCVSCQNINIDLAVYPFFKSPLFLRSLLFRCDVCGLYWTPKLPFDLNKYYQESYAKDVQIFRTANNFYDPRNPFWESLPAERFLKRAKRHISLIHKHIKPQTILDFGAGIGITLSLIDCKIKRAIEPDKYAQKILKSIGVEITELESSENYDVIISSHSLEHLESHNINKVLSEFRKKLNENGMLLIEVPPGASQISELTHGPVDKRGRLEPHTLFFSSLSLFNLLAATGFTVCEMSLCQWTREFMARQNSSSEALFPGVSILSGTTLVALAKKKEHA